MLKTNNDKVSILCADVGINCLSRAITLAEIVSRDHEVQIIGFITDLSKFADRTGNGIRLILQIKSGK